MNFTPKRDFGPRRLPVQWVDSPMIGPLVISRHNFIVRRHAAPKTPRAGFQLSQRSAVSFPNRSLCAFTLLELMMVIGIIGLIAALALPHVGGMGQANSMTTATRQLLDDVAFARQRAMVNRSTVYMVFLPPMFWTNNMTVTYPSSSASSHYYGPAQNVLSGSQLTNLMAHQYSAYAFVTLSSVGDQPGAHYARYISDWKTLPSGVFIAPFEFGLTNYNYTNLMTTNTLSGSINNNYVYGWTVSPPVPFPSLFPPNGAVSATMSLPCIAFSPQGSLTTQYTNQYIALARGSVLYPTDTNGVPVMEAPILAENPAGNDAKNPNLIQIDWMTARATLVQNQFQ
jgi:prepilin-type N-terminal cleavage/methylation domain-containing protein